MVTLKVIQFDVQLFCILLCEGDNVGESFVAVNVRFTSAEKIEIGTVD